MKKMGKPPFYDATPARMSRSGGKSKGGNTFSIPSGAKYGVDGSQPPTRMDRSVPKGKSGNNFSIPCNGPARASRKDTGANSSMGKGYGVKGVPLVSGEGRYGV